MIILDVGAGTAGCASVMATSADDTTVAVDRNIRYLRQHRFESGDRHVFRVVADAAWLPVPENRVDLVVCTEMLEHVPNYREVLAEVSRVGRRGCGYYISVPVGRWERLFRMLHPRWLAHSGHVNVFSAAALADELRAHGIRVTGFHGVNSWSFLYWCCHSLARSNFEDSGRTLNHLWIDAMAVRAERWLRRLRLWRALNSVGDRCWPKSWVIHAAKD